MDDDRELRPGDLFAGHRIEAVAGRGGMGVVYRAIALDLDRTVALKLIAPSLSEDLTFRERFIRETQVAASLDHPNVVPVYAAGEEDGRLFFTMRYVAGDDLRSVIRHELRLSPSRAAAILAQIGAALDAAHARGIVHRDVKPANVLLTPAEPYGHAYLTDFGLTKRVHSTAADTRPGGWVGTLGYVAPEQIRGARVDARTDVYALGCILFHALTGAAPYARESDEATLWAHLNDPPPALSPRAPHVPGAFEAVIARAMAKAPEDRYPSAGALGRAALAAAGVGVAPSAETSVARGAASSDEEETRAPGADHAPPEAATLVTGPTRPNPPTEGEASPTPSQALAARSRTGLLLAGVLMAAVLGAGAALALSRGGEADPAPQTISSASTPDAAPRNEVNRAGKLTARIPTGRRPNAVVVAGDRLWVASQSEPRLRLFETLDNDPVPQSPKVGVGANALAVGFNSVWVVKGTTQSLLRYSTRKLDRVGAATDLPPGSAVAGATAKRAVWIGNRSGRDDGVEGAVRVDVDGSTRVRPTIELDDGVQDLAVGYGSVWVVGRNQPRVTRIDQETGKRTRYALGGEPQRIAVGAGAAWVSNDEGLVSRIDVESGNVQRIGVGREPRGIAVNDDAVWVACSLDGTLTRLDPKTGEVVGRPVKVGANPSAVAVFGTTAWVSLLADDAVARVDFLP